MEKQPWCMFWRFKTFSASGSFCDTVFFYMIIFPCGLINYRRVMSSSCSKQTLDFPPKARIGILTYMDLNVNMQVVSRSRPFTAGRVQICACTTTLMFTLWTFQTHLMTMMDHRLILGSASECVTAPCLWFSSHSTSSVTRWMVWKMTLTYACTDSCFNLTHHLKLAFRTWVLLRVRIMILYILLWINKSRVLALFEKQGYWLNPFNRFDCVCTYVRTHRQTCLSLAQAPELICTWTEL